MQEVGILETQGVRPGHGQHAGQHTVDGRDLLEETGHAAGLADLLFRRYAVAGGQ